LIQSFLLHQRINPWTYSGWYACIKDKQHHPSQAVSTWLI